MNSFWQRGAILFCFPCGQQTSYSERKVGSWKQGAEYGRSRIIAFALAREKEHKNEA